MHLQELVEVGNFHARAPRDALLAAGLQDLRIGALTFRHRLHERDLLLDDLVIETGLLDLLGHLSHAGHHAHDTFHAAHLHHLFELHLQVVHVELALLEALHHALGLFLLDRVLCLLDEADDVAHAEDSPGDPVRLEGFQRVHLLAEADETDRLARHRAHRERRAAAPVAVHPCEDDAADPDLGVELLGHLDSDLACQPVDDKKRLARVDDIAHVLDLFHQHFVDLKPARRVEHVDIIAAEAGLLLGALGDLDRRFALHDGERVNADLGTENFELVHRGRAVDIERGHEDFLALAVLEALGELACRGCLAAALKADHQDRCGGIVDLELAGVFLAAQRFDERVMDDLDDLLAGGDRLGDSLARGLLLHLLDELARDGQRNVRLQKRDAHLAQGRLHIFFGKCTLLGEPVEDAGEAFGQVFKHLFSAPLAVSV